MLRIHLFGGFHAYDGTVPIEHFAAPKVEALFSYLLVRRGRLWSRDTLMDLFWSDAGSAEPRSCLNSSLSRLRSALGPFDRRDCLVVRESLTHKRHQLTDEVVVAVVEEDLVAERWCRVLGKRRGHVVGSG